MNRMLMGLVSVFVAGGVIVWFAAPKTNTAAGAMAAMLAGGEDWHLPPKAVNVTTSDLDLVGKPEMWGFTPVTHGDDKPLTAPNWRIVGVFANGETRQAVMRMVGAPDMQSLSVGDELPGGARILAINEDYLAILLNGKRRVLRIHG